jgi:eukaryotic-like serine/threonine-protein kinase
VKLLDFGLAKVAPLQVSTEAPTRTGRMTEAGLVMGTARYMSPEQACGQRVDVRTDVWSLGVVLYEMATGRLPFEGATTGEVLSELLHGAEPPPLARFGPDSPAELQRIVSRALAKNREERYQSMQDLALDLKELRQKLDFEAKRRREMPPREQTPAPVPAGGVAPSAPAVGGMWRRLVAVATRRRAVLVTALLAASAVGIATHFRPPRGAAIDSLAVLPFAAPGADADTDLLADGITESLINSLSQHPDLKLIARGSGFRYKGKEVDPREAARELGVGALVTGRLARRGDRLQIGVELTDVRENRHLWGEQFTPRFADLLTIQQEISGQITDQLRQRLTREQRSRVGKRPTDNLEAYRLYLLGRHYWFKFRQPEFQKSRDYFQQAIDLDPSYALAHAGLADFYGFSAVNGLLPPAEAWPKAEAAARAALRLDENLAEVQNFLAAQKLYIYGDWSGAEHHFKRAIELNPSYAEVYAHYAALLLRQGRIEESLAKGREAQELDPLSAVFHRRLAHNLYLVRRVGEAIAEYGKALELDSGDFLAHEQLGDAYELAGRPGDAVKEWSTALTLAGNRELAALLERTYAESGFEAAVKTLARARLGQLRSRAERGEYVQAMEFVPLHLRLGEREPAFEWLAKAEGEQHNSRLLSIGVDPIFDPVRADPRFVDLVRRLGLPVGLAPPPPAG